VNHQESIGVLLHSILEDGTGVPPSDRQRREAEEHVANCSDCWEMLAVLTTAATGTPPADLERVRSLYGCDAVRDELWLLEGLSRVQIEQQHPHIARHLVWCHSCRDRFVEITQVARAESAGEFGAPLFGPAVSTVWRQTVEAAGRSVRELAGSMVVAIESGIAAFTLVPDGVSWVGVPAAAARAARGTSERRRQVRFPLADSGLSADVTLHSEAGGRLQVEVRVSGDDGRPLSIHLRAGQPPQTELLGSQSIASGEPAVFRDLPEGDYQLEIRDRQSGGVYRVALAVQVMS
jgi:hypothetical protein